MSPSAFIPFCEFGGKMSNMAEKIGEFNIPVCTSFQDKIIYDQLCYEVDLNKLSDKANILNELKSGFIFVMDYNEDRQFKFDENMNITKEDSLASKIINSDDDKQASIYLNTIGKIYRVSQKSVPTLYFSFK